jgi:hypothetical protein
MKLQDTSTTQAVSTLTGAEPGLPSAVSPAAADSASLLPEPGSIMLGANVGAMIAELAIKNGELENRINNNAAEAQNTMEDAANQAQVAELHQEASDTRNSALIGGTLQVGAGLCSVAAAGASGGAAVGGNGASPATSATATAQFIDNLKTLGGVGQLLKGASQSLDGAGTLTGGLGKAAATDDEALAAQSKALADIAQRGGDAARDAHKNSEAFVQSAIDFYREYESTQAAAQAAAVHRA